MIVHSNAVFVAFQVAIHKNAWIAIVVYWSFISMRFFFLYSTKGNCGFRASEKLFIRPKKITTTRNYSLTCSTIAQQWKKKKKECQMFSPRMFQISQILAKHDSLIMNMQKVRRYRRAAILSIDACFSPLSRPLPLLLVLAYRYQYFLRQKRI